MFLAFCVMLLKLSITVAEAQNFHLASYRYSAKFRYFLYSLIISSLGIAPPFFRPTSLKVDNKHAKKICQKSQIRNQGREYSKNKNLEEIDLKDKRVSQREAWQVDSNRRQVDNHY